MRIRCLMLACIAGLSSTLWATPDISVELTRFQGDKGPYVEMSMYVVGSTLICDSMHQRHGLDYVVLVEDQLGNIVFGDRFRLSREGCPAKDLIDIRRFPIGAGQYKFVIEAVDLNDTLNQIGLTLEKEIPETKAGASLSDIELLSVLKNQGNVESPFIKSGLYMEPLAFRYYYPALHQLHMYVEAYQADQLNGQPYMQYTIKPVQGDIPKPLVAYRKVKKEAFTSNVFQLDISELISGQYWIEAILYDGDKNPVAASKAAFSRSNPTGDSIFAETALHTLDFGFVQNIPEDSLDYCLRAMAPVVNQMDVEVLNTLLAKGNEKTKRYFIHRYWTNQAGKMAGPAFFGYMKVAKVVDATYRSGFGYGFETDRGHIFLKYGKPNDVLEVEDEPSAPPYEIWYYHHFPATHQSNVRFLFYNPTLAKNAFTLLHSTAIGEIRNDRWEIELYRDATQETPGVNDRVMGDNVHRNARKYFETY